MRRRIELSVTPLTRSDPRHCIRYRDLGVELVLLPNARDEVSLLRWVDETAESLVRKLA